MDAVGLITEITFNWEPVLWVGGIFMAVITGLLAWIGAIIKADRDHIDVRLEKYEKWILAQQRELAGLAKQTEVAVELIKVEQKMSNEKLRLFEEYLKESRRK